MSQQNIEVTGEMSGRERRRLRREAERQGNDLPGVSSGGAWKIWLGALGLLVVVAGVVIALVVAANKPTIVKLAVPVGAGDWTTGGTATSTLSLVEYSDFQCPACAFYAPLVKQLLTDVPEVALTYRNFPLPQHANAELSARAAEAAGRQGHYWEMHDLLFAHQTDWAEKTNTETEALFTGYATSLGVNATQFKKDLESPEIAAKVASDRQGGLDSGVNSTPSFFLNGTIINNPQTYDQFVGLIRAALASSSPAHS